MGSHKTLRSPMHQLLIQRIPIVILSIFTKRVPYERIMNQITVFFPHSTVTSVERFLYLLTGSHHDIIGQMCIECRDKPCFRNLGIRMEIKKIFVCMYTRICSRAANRGRSFPGHPINRFHEPGCDRISIFLYLKAMVGSPAITAPYKQIALQF